MLDGQLVVQYNCLTATSDSMITEGNFITTARTLKPLLSENVKFIQKVTFGPLMDFKQNHYGIWKYYKNSYL